MPMAGRQHLPQASGRPAPDRHPAARRGGPGPDPVRPRRDDSPAPGAGRRAGRGRAGRGRAERADRARMPGRPPLGSAGPHC